MNSIPAKKILLALMSGLLITASFPPLKTDWLIWVSIIPLLISIEGTSPGAFPQDEGTSPWVAFKLGILAGLAHFLSLIYWIINVLNIYGGLDIFTSIFILLLLCLYLSIYMGIFSSLVSIFRHSHIKIFLFAGIWVSLEYIREFIFTGFPWGLLGYSLYHRLTIAQVADITGVYGLSFIIVAFNVFIFQLIVGFKGIFKNRFFISETLILFILACAYIIYGNNCLARYNDKIPEGSGLNIAIIQGNIDQAVKWNTDFQEKTLDKYIDLTRSSLHTKPDIIIWPETAVPLFFQDKDPLSEELEAFIKECRTNFIFGSPSYKIDRGTVRYYNTAWDISPEGEIKGQYNKNHLVPFGEYVPFQQYLPFVHRLVPAAGDFSRGDSTDPLMLGKIPAGILICYEVIFPEIARHQVLKGARLIINITNDAWFGFTSAPYQHLFMSVFRAIENRRPLLRSANTGISAVIDSRGQVIKHGDLFTEEVITARISTGENTLTFYTRFGDIFASGILILCLIKIFVELCYSRKKK